MMAITAMLNAAHNQVARSRKILIFRDWRASPPWTGTPERRKTIGAIDVIRIGRTIAVCGSRVLATLIPQFVQLPIYEYMKSQWKLIIIITRVPPMMVQVIYEESMKANYNNHTSSSHGRRHRFTWTRIWGGLLISRVLTSSNHRYHFNVWLTWIKSQPESSFFWYNLDSWPFIIWATCELGNSRCDDWKTGTREWANVTSFRTSLAFQKRRIAKKGRYKFWQCASKFLQYYHLYSQLYLWNLQM